MSKLSKYARKSELMEIKLKYGDEEFNFNLHREIIVDENNINEELKIQPSSYSFLTMLHKKLIKYYEDILMRTKRVYAKLFIKFKQENLSSINRIPSDDMVKEMIVDNEEYKEVVDEMIKAKHDMEVIEACVRAFEQRKDLIQSLSANLRKEKN